jgi:hypothetical protein
VSRLRRGTEGEVDKSCPLPTRLPPDWQVGETKGEATEMMSTYLGDDADALDGF